MREISRRALDLLRDATRCELLIVKVEEKHHCKSHKVVRQDRTGNEQQVKTLGGAGALWAPRPRERHLQDHPERPGRIGRCRMNNQEGSRLHHKLLAAELNKHLLGNAVVPAVAKSVLLEVMDAA